MPLGTGTIRLSDIINEFGGGAGAPNNFLSYLKLAGAPGLGTVRPGGWFAGVAEHENNLNIPTLPPINFSQFRSVSNYITDKDFESDTWVATESTYSDFSNNIYESLAGIWNSSFYGAAGFSSVNSSGGTIGTINYLGKSTFNTGLTANIIAIADGAETNPFDATPSNAYFALQGDHRATGWGNPWISVSMTDLGTSVTTTLNRLDSDTPNGVYNSANDTTYWKWSSVTFGFPYTGGSVNSNIKFSVRII